MHQRIKAVLSLVVVVAFSIPGWACAGLVKLTYEGLSLNAHLEMAPGKSMQDGVILMTHGTLGHGRMEIMETLQDSFKEKGLNTLSITLSLGLDDRQGMYDCNKPHRHTHTDALGEIGAWVAWLKRQGAKDIVLLGHSRGGNQTAWFTAEHPDDSIRQLILIAPSLWTAEEAAQAYEKRYRTPLKLVLGKAQALVKKGEGKEFIPYQNFLYCPNASVTAESFASYYAPDPRLDTLHLVPKIKQRVLLFAGTQDDVVIGLDTKAAPMADGKRVQLVVIDGADHFFRDLYAMEIVDRIADFLAQK